MGEKLSQHKIDSIIQLSELGKTQQDISDVVGVSISTVNKYLNKIKETTKGDLLDGLSKEQIQKLDLIKNLSPKEIKEILYQNTIATNSDKVNIKTEEIGHALFGAIGDTHLCAKAHNNAGLHKYYDKIQERGIKTVLHAGDLVDGHNVYKGHVFELLKHGADAQVDYVINHYPKREGVDTYFINGNHDESLLQLAGYDIGKTIEQLRDDMHYLGFYNARIKLNGVDIELQHGGGSNSYAWSYKPQKYLENADPKDQPNVFLLGHYHTALYMFYRKIHTFMVGAFQGENNLTKRFKLGNTQGGWIVEVTLDNQGGTTINMEFIKV